MASSSLRACVATKSAVGSPIRPWRWASAMLWLKEWTPWPRTSLSMYAASRRAASREYSGSSATSSAAVWIDSRSSSSVVAPSYRPLIVFVATRNGSTVDKPVAQRSTARTILSTWTSSNAPLRLRTRIVGCLLPGSTSTWSTGVTVTALSPRELGLGVVATRNREDPDGARRRRCPPARPRGTKTRPPAAQADELAGLRTHGHADDTSSVSYWPSLPELAFSAS